MIHSGPGGASAGTMISVYDDGHFRSAGMARGLVTTSRDSGPRSGPRCPRRIAEPTVMVDIRAQFEPQNPDLALSHADLLSFLEVTTRDGVSWGLGVADEVKDIIDTGMDVSDEDLVQQALAGQPDVVEAAHPDREDYRIHLARPLPADEVLARVIDAIAAAHRKLARQLRIDIPE